MKTLFIIPARGGSKGVPKKNIKPLNGKPLIFYSIDLAREISVDEDICISTDDLEIINCIEKERHLKIHFTRPNELSTDTSGTYDVLIHAINYYKNIGKEYHTIVLLQPTSPFRRTEDIKECLTIFKSNNLDMVVSVCESKANPYFNLFEENSLGYLEKSKNGKFTRRQDCPKVYEYNGAVYVIKVESLLKGEIINFKLIKKYIMPKEYSLDIDTPLDWEIAEFFMAKYSKNGF